MKTSMLEYTKIILEKVSFDKRLFVKEYKKSILRLHAAEVSALKHWLRIKYLSGQLTGSNQV